MSFSALLDPKDRERCRQLCRMYDQRKMGNGRKPLTDEQCDMLIDSFGPAVAEKLLRSSVDQGLVH